MTPSEEVSDATGESNERENVIDLLAAKREALVAAEKDYKVCKEMRDQEGMSIAGRLKDALAVIINELETEAAVVVEATGRKEAVDRLRGIKRAYGSVLTEYQEDDGRVQQAVAALSEEITALNARARKLEAIRAEAAALSDRFSLPVPILGTVAEPRYDVASSLPAFWQYRAVRPSFEQCEHNLRTRRDYTEISGSPGYAIITKAGLRPFRPLTEQEKEVLEDKAEWKPDPVLAAAATEATALSQLRVPGGGVARG